MDPRNGEVLALGSVPELRRQPVRQADHAGAPTTSSTPRRPARRCSTARSPASIRPARPSSRSPRWPRSRRASSRRRTDHRRPGRVQDRRRRASATPATPSTARRAAARAPGLLRRLLLQLGARAQLAQGRSSRRGRASSASASRTGIDLPGEFGGLVPDRKWRDAGFAEYEKLRKRKKVPATRRRRRCSACGGIDAPVDRAATTSTSRSARATCRPRRCRWRSPTRRSPTAARVVRPHLGLEVEDGHGRAARSGSTHRRHGASRSTPPTRPGAILDGLHAARRRPAARRPTSSRAWQAATRSTARPAPRSARRSPTSPGTSPTSPIPADPIVVAVTVERAASAPRRPRPAARLILVEVVRLGKTEFNAGSVARPDERQTRPIQPASEPPAAARPARSGACALDPLLLLAVARPRAPARSSRSAARPRDDIAGAARLLRRPPGALRRRRRSCSCRRLARRLLAAARAQVRPLRRC